MNYPKPDPGLINCASCRRVNVPGCPECRRCAEGCGCYCRDCWNCTPMVLTDAGRRHMGNPVRHHPKYICHVCRQCRRHNVDQATRFECKCRKRPSRSRHDAVEGAAQTNTLQRPLGLEVEVSYMGTAAAIDGPAFLKYQWVHDGSITQGGQELVVEPLIGDNFILGIGAVGRHLRQYEFRADPTCGLHVHVGVGEWGPYELRRLILLYHRFEDVFYNLVQPGRDGFRIHRGEPRYYCKRFPMPDNWYEGLTALTTGAEIRKYLLSWMYAGRAMTYRDGAGETHRRKPRAVHNGGAAYSMWPLKLAVDKTFGLYNMPEIRNHKYENVRYLGLNLHTWFQRGTVEYRHHEGTVAVDKLLMWPLWCGWFTELASVMTDREVANCQTLDALLDTEYKRLYTLVSIPPPVREWVRRTLEQRKEKK